LGKIIIPLIGTNWVNSCRLRPTLGQVAISFLKFRQSGRAYFKFGNFKQLYSILGNIQQLHCDGHLQAMPVPKQKPRKLSKRKIPSGAETIKTFVWPGW